VDTKNGSLQSESPSGKSLNKDVKFDGLFHEWGNEAVEAGEQGFEISPLALWKTNRTIHTVNRTTLNFGQNETRS
jgi:hypothetical protein